MTSNASFPIAAALLLCALLTGCGGSNRAAVRYQAFETALKAAACIRANGVPSYPDPELIHGTIKLSFTASVNPTAPAVQTAAKKCGYQTEVQAEETRSRIVFVGCMRSHGVSNFPYPTAQGGVSVAMVRARGIDPQSPAVARVVSECLPPWLQPPRGP